MTMNWKVPFSRRNDNWRNPLETHNISVSTKVTFGWRKTSVGYDKRIITALITEFCEIEFSCMTRLFTLVHVPFLCRNSSITNSVFEPDLFIMWFFCRKCVQKTEIFRWILLTENNRFHDRILLYIVPFHCI